MRTALSEWERSGFQTGTPHNFGMLARSTCGWGGARRADHCAERPGPSSFQRAEEGWKADLHLIRGRLLRLGGRDAEAGRIPRALHIAREQGLRLFMRRAQAWLHESGPGEHPFRAYQAPP